MNRSGGFQSAISIGPPSETGRSDGDRCLRNTIFQTSSRDSCSSLPAECSYPVQTFVQKGSKSWPVYREKRIVVTVVGEKRTGNCRREGKREKRGGAKRSWMPRVHENSSWCVTGKHNGRESSNNAQRLSYNTPGGNVWALTGSKRQTAN